MRSVLLSLLLLGCAVPDPMRTPVTQAQMEKEATVLPTLGNPVVVIVHSLESDDWGQTRRFGDAFLIEIHEDLDAWHATRILMHEWAHVLAWDDEEYYGDHCGDWGEYYAMCYRAMFPEK